MREKAHLFDENLTRRFRNDACGLPFEAGGVKITQSGERERLVGGERRRAPRRSRWSCSARLDGDV